MRFNANHNCPGCGLLIEFWSSADIPGLSPYQQFTPGESIPAGLNGCNVESYCTDCQKHMTGVVQGLSQDVNDPSHVVFYAILDLTNHLAPASPMENPE